MGVSVSVSAAIIFVGLFISLGMVYPSVANGYENVEEAQTNAADRELDTKNTDIAVSNATYSGGTLTVNVTNEGTTALAVDATDVIVDGTYETSFDRLVVEGDSETSLWLPGETLTVEVSEPTQPNRVVVVTEGGVEAGVTL
jgi:flagellar protein FlaF